MPRTKKEESKKKSKKYVEEDDDEIIEDSPKRTRKSSSKSKGKKVKKVKEEEDNLSEIDIDEEENQDDGEENDEVVNSKPNRPERKRIDGENPLNTYKTDEILSYLIQMGIDTMNPGLKTGALDLLNTLKGRRRRFTPNYGSKRGGYGNGRGGYPPRMMNYGRPPPGKQYMRQQPQENEDIYDGADQ